MIECCANRRNPDGAMFSSTNLLLSSSISITNVKITGFSGVPFDQAQRPVPRHLCCSQQQEQASICTSLRRKRRLEPDWQRTQKPVRSLIFRQVRCSNHHSEPEVSSTAGNSAIILLSSGSCPFQFFNVCQQSSFFLRHRLLTVWKAVQIFEELRQRFLGI